MLKTSVKNGERIHSVESRNKGERKKFQMGIAYPDLAEALIRRGWMPCGRETGDNHLHLKFVLSSSQIDYHKISKDASINHCRGEACITCKT